MVGALLLLAGMRRRQAATVESMDIDALTRMWADDVTLTFMGGEPIVGKPAVEAWYRAWFASLVAVHEQPRNFAVTRPLAVGGTNTVLWESVGQHDFTDGSRVTGTISCAIDFVRGKARAIRIYVADPAGERAYLRMRPAPAA